MRFQNPEFLILIPIFLLVLFFIRKRKDPVVKFSSFKVLFKKKPFNRKHLVVLPKFALNLAFIIMVVAFARPQFSHQKTARTIEGLDIHIVLDISGSMAIEDFEKQSRLDVAKETIKNFIKERSSDKIGLTVFSGEAVTIIPNTLDYNILIEQLKQVSLQTLKDGTAIGDALATAVSRLKNSTLKNKTIIIVTDGDNNQGIVDPLTAGELAKGYGIRVYSIGIGKEGQVPMPYIQEDFFGGKHKAYQMVENTINPELLQKISAETNGKFFRAEDSETLVNVFKEIDSLEKNRIEIKENVKYEEQFQILLAISIALILFYFVSIFTFARVLP